LPPRRRSAGRAVIALVAALALWLVLWETVLAPVRPGGSWLALKALPLALLLPGIAAGRLRTRQWASLLLPFYGAEAIVRALTEPGRHGVVAACAFALALAAFAMVLRTFRAAP
jgi:uncharacterized membrane protein